MTTLKAANNQVQQQQVAIGNFSDDIETQKKIIQSLSEENEELKNQIKDLKLRLQEAGQPIKADIEIMRERALEYLHKAYVRQPMQVINDRIEIEGKIKKCTYKYEALNPHAPDRFTPSRARCAENCGSALTHR